MLPGVSNRFALFPFLQFEDGSTPTDPGIIALFNPRSVWSSGCGARSSLLHASGRTLAPVSCSRRCPVGFSGRRTHGLLRPGAQRLVLRIPSPRTRVAGIAGFDFPGSVGKRIACCSRQGNTLIALPGSVASMEKN